MSEQRRTGLFSDTFNTDEPAYETQWVWPDDAGKIENRLRKAAERHARQYPGGHIRTNARWLHSWEIWTDRGHVETLTAFPIPRSPLASP